MKAIIKKLLWPLWAIKHSIDRYLSIHNPEKLFCIRYRRMTGHKLNVKSPVTLYDKIAYMEFHTDTTLWSELSDKVSVRNFVKKCGYEKSLPKLYGVWDDADDIDFGALPESFVLKTNNASSTNIVVRDKNTINIDEIKSRLNNWLKWEYGVETCQPHYSKIVPKILAEEFLIDDETSKIGKSLIDYKFYCIEGCPVYVQVMTDRDPSTHKFKVMLYDMDWNRQPQFLLNYYDHISEGEIHRPASFEKMKEIAQNLTKGLHFCRVDLYEINGKPYFGEMTFTPGHDTLMYEFHVEAGKMCRI